MILLVLSALWLSLLGIVWIFAAKPSWAWREDEFASIEQWAQLRLALGHLIAFGGVIPPGPAERPSRGRSSRRPRDTFSPAGPRLSSLQHRLGAPLRSGPPTLLHVAHATSE